MLLAVPEPSRAVATVPLERLPAFKLVREAPEPEKVPAVAVPLHVAAAPLTVPVKVGEADNTTEPVPVEVVTPVPPLATGSVPVTPVDKGSPVALVRTTADGVPNACLLYTSPSPRD